MHAPIQYATSLVVSHWLMAVLIVGTFALGDYVSDLRLSPTKLQLISYHKWLGVTVFVLLLWRIASRLTRPVPPPLPAPAWQQRVAGLTHGLLYTLMLAVPLTGWLMSSAKGFPVVYLGVLPLPDLVAKDEALGDLFKGAHEILTSGLLLLVGLHVAAALKHHLIDRDATLARMLPVFKRTPAKES